MKKIVYIAFGYFEKKSLLIFFLMLHSSMYAFDISAETDYKILKGAEIEYLKDKYRAYNFTNLPFEKFQPFSKNSPNFGLYNGAVWLRLKITSLQAQQIFLELKNPILDSIEVYENSSNGIHLVDKFGDRYRFSNRPYPHRFFRLKINIPNEILIRVNNMGDLLIIPINIATERGIKQRDLYGQFLWGIFLGLIIVFLAINIMLLIFSKIKDTFYYIGYLIFITLVQFCFSGIGFQYILPNHPELVNRLLPAAGSLSIYFVLIFTRKFLQLQSNFLFLNRTFLVFELISLIIVGIQFIPGDMFYYIGIVLTNVFVLISSILGFVAAILSYRKESRPILYFLIALTCLIGGSFVFILRNIGIIPDVLWTEYSLQIATASFAGFVTLAILQVYKDNKMEAITNLRKMDALRKNEGEMMDKEIEEKTKEFEAKKEEIALKNQEIFNSINFANKIQGHLLPERKRFLSLFDESFLLFNPKDILSGDFYWKQPIYDDNSENVKSAFCIGDCTGHGVPGAMISVLALRFLSSAVLELGLKTPAEILNYVSVEFTNSFVGNQNRANISDGMDCMVCVMNYQTKVMTYAGAKNGFILIRDSKISLHRGNKFSIGGLYKVDEKYQQYEIQLQKGDKVYLFTDGFTDQFGGEKNKKIKIDEIRRLLLDHHQKPMAQQEQIISQFFQTWKGTHEQTDDVTIFGFSINE